MKFDDEVPLGKSSIISQKFARARSMRNPREYSEEYMRYKEWEDLKEESREKQARRSWEVYCDQEERINYEASRNFSEMPPEVYEEHLEEINFIETDKLSKFEKKIRKIVKDRGITKLVHFTRVDNLASILKHGLLSRNKLDNENIKYESNDDDRVDKQLTASCLSISFPNYRFFYKSRNKEENWVVLELRPEILWEKEVVFCVNNASNSKIIVDRSQSQSQKINYFKKMFKNNYLGNNRLDLNLPANYTTHPEAEVLVYDTIEPDYIFGISFFSIGTISQSEDIKRLISKNGIRLKKNRDLFDARSDWKYWQK